MWRKTRSKEGDVTCFGVDGNRNFDANWGGPGASAQPCSETYFGPSLASEPMTQFLTNFVDNNSERIKVIITHFNIII